MRNIFKHSGEQVGDTIDNTAMWYFGDDVKTGYIRAWARIFQLIRRSIAFSHFSLDSVINLTSGIIYDFRLRFLRYLRVS